jgi:parallel beta-helix repeat protein
MTISTTESRISYNGNGVTTVFSFPYRFLVNGDLVVVEVSAAGVETTKTLTTDYTITGAGDDAGGSVTMLAAPAVGTRLVIYRDTEVVQETDYVSGDPFPAETHERALDRLTMIAQEIGSDADRSIKVPVGDSSSLSTTLPASANRLDKFLVFDATTGATELSTVTQTQVASAVAAAYAAGSTADAVTFLHSGLGAIATSVQAYLRTFGVSAPAWGVPIDGTEGATEMAALMAAHLNIYMPPGNYLFSSSLTLRNGHTIVGAGRLQAIITSGVIGDSLFKNTGSYTGFLYMADMQLIGNGLTGASGNGHAINLIDPAIGSGSFTPAQCAMERLYIRNFKGLDRRDNVPTAIDACAIINVDGLGNVFRDISIENCGHGIYLHLSQNCRIVEPLITGCSGWGIHSYDTENTVIYGGDVNTCGTNGVTDPTGRIEAGMGTGNVLSARDEGFELWGMKVKGSPGTAQMHAFITSACIAGGWIRADHIIDKEFIGVLVTQPLDVSVVDNDFSPTSGAPYSATQKITNVKVTVLATHNIAKARINDNQFRTQGGTLMRANVHLQGNSSGTRMEGLEVQGNSFGMPINVSVATTIDTDVLLDTGTFANSIFRGNSHYDATNVTKTAHYEVAGGATYKYNDFDCNSATNQGTGAIALTFSGFQPGLESISAAKTFALVDGDRTFLHPSADTSARTWQIPANSTAPYAIGTKITIINQDSAGVITLAVVTDTMRLAGAGTTGNRSIAANGRAVVEKVAATEWIISGTGVT